MAANLLTDRTVLKAKATEKEVQLNDGNGLYLRVLPSGTKSWLFQYKKDKKTHRKSLGLYPDVTLAEAREEVIDLRRDVQNGVDIHNTNEDPETLDDLFDVWFKKYVVLNRTSEDNNKALTSRYNRFVKPRYGDQKLATLKRGDMVRLLDVVVGAGVNRQAKLVLSEMRQMLTYAAVREWIQGDPTVGIAKKSVGGAEIIGERVLPEDELCSLKVILGSPTVRTRLHAGRVLPLRTEIAVWLALTTLARSVELATVRAADLDLDAWLWQVPGDIAKNEIPHTIHLNAFSVRLFEILLSLDGVPNAAGYLFKGARGREYIDPKAFTRELTDRQGREKPLKGRRNSTELCLKGGHWTMHDLRRTGATMMGEMGYDDKLIDLCLNHVEINKLKKTYQKQKRMPERKAAFEALGAKLEELLGGLDWLPTPPPPKRASPRSRGLVVPGLETAQS